MEVLMRAKCSNRVTTARFKRLAGDTDGSQVPEAMSSYQIRNASSTWAFHAAKRILPIAVIKVYSDFRKWGSHTFSFFKSGVANICVCLSCSRTSKMLKQPHNYELTLCSATWWTLADDKHVLGNDTGRNVSPYGLRGSGSIDGRPCAHLVLHSYGTWCCLVVSFELLYVAGDLVRLHACACLRLWWHLEAKTN